MECIHKSKNQRPREDPGLVVSLSVDLEVILNHLFFLWIFQGHKSGWRFGLQFQLPSLVLVLVLLVLVQPLVPPS